MKKSITQINKDLDLRRFGKNEYTKASSKENDNGGEGDSSAPVSPTKSMPYFPLPGKVAYFLDNNDWNSYVYSWDDEYATLKKDPISAENFEDYVKEKWEEESQGSTYYCYSGYFMPIFEYDESLLMDSRRALTQLNVEYSPQYGFLVCNAETGIPYKCKIDGKDYVIFVVAGD